MRRIIPALISLALFFAGADVSGQQISNSAKTFVPAGYRGRSYTDSAHSIRQQVIPGKIECAYFDVGGEGVAYHDLEQENRGSGGLNLQPNHQRPHATEYHWSFRKDESVDVSYTKDFADFNHNNNYYIPAFNQFYIGWTEDHEWLNYTVDVKVAGTYQIEALYANNDSTISFDIDQKPAVTCRIPLQTANFHAWNKAVIGSVTIKEAGLHLLTFHYNKGNNFAYFEFTLTDRIAVVSK
jgi:Carbohydrate binding module (family 6)